MVVLLEVSTHPTRGLGMAEFMYILKLHTSTAPQRKVSISSLDLYILCCIRDGGVI